MLEPDDLKPDDPLSPEEEARTSQLTAADLQRIDECLLSHMSHRWQKVARVVALTMRTLDREFPDLPAVFYSLRIKSLVESGAVEAAGDLNRMRFSEVRIPDSNQAGRQ